MDNDASVYDVVVIGGALSGGATATLLLRSNPGLNILILEKSAQFTRRVGEATVEVSAFFMGRVLGMTKYLNEFHLVKQGLRFWFTNDEVESLGDAGEVGGHYQVRLPSYQLDRATFDEEVLRRACVAGAKLLRPVSVTKVELNPGGAGLWMRQESLPCLLGKKVGGGKTQTIPRRPPGLAGRVLRTGIVMS
jgi:flavin-dependent dehydrogenase